MRMIPSMAYWQAVAQGVDAEDRKASLFVRHPGSRGGAREAILRALLIHQTPEPYRVNSGFICEFAGTEPRLSRQCDVLVFDPRVPQPYYAIDAFVVIPRAAARLAVEVKSDLGQDDLDDMCVIAESVRQRGVPTLGFAFGGWTFETAVERLASHVARD